MPALARRNANAQTLIDLRGVGKHYDLPRESNVVILDNLNFQVREGEFLAVLGPSGSGKSTLLRIIAGLVRPTHGEILYQGQPINGVNPGVAMVFQNFALFPWLTVLENVELAIKQKGLPAAERRQKALRVIDLVGLDGFETAYPRELSGGMRQRVGFGRALAVEPDVLLMDEPFSALDVLTAENLRRDLLELWLEKKIPTKAIIMVTHGIEEAVYMADRAIVLSRDPARVIADIPIALPHWRERKDKAFTRLVDYIYNVLTRPQVEQPSDAAAEQPARQFNTVPAARAGALTGLIEFLDDLNRRVDLYEVGDALRLDLEDFLPIVEAANLLGFARLHEGDIELTDIGRAFAAASVVERKEMFKTQVLERVPVMEKILWILSTKSNQQMPAEFFLDILERNFSPSESERQLDNLIDWGRYAELFAYDEKSRRIYLEQATQTEG